MKIVRTVIRLDTRPPGKTGMVIGELWFDDDTFETAIFESPAGEDAQKRLDGMIPQREADRNAFEAEKAIRENEGKARDKIEASVSKADPAALKAAYDLTDAEIAALKR